MTTTENQITIHPVSSTTWTEVPATAFLSAGQWHFRVKIASSAQFRNAPVDLASPVPVYAIERALSGSFGESAEIVQARRTA
jgi:hypothetical protein